MSGTPPGEETESWETPIPSLRPVYFWDKRRSSVLVRSPLTVSLPFEGGLCGRRNVMTQGSLEEVGGRREEEKGRGGGERRRDWFFH